MLIQIIHIYMEADIPIQSNTNDFYTDFLDQ